MKILLIGTDLKTCIFVDSIVNFSLLQCLLKFFQAIYFSILIIRPLLTPNELLNYSYSMIFVLFTGSIINLKNDDLNLNSKFVASFADFFDYHSDLFKDIVTALVQKNNNWYSRLIFNLLNIQKIQNIWNEIILTLFSFRKQGRIQWRNKYLPLFSRLNPLFHQIIEFCPSINQIVRLWKQSIKWIKLHDLQIVLPNHSNADVKAIYWSIFNISEWERFTPSVRKSIDILEITDKSNSDHIIYNDCLIWKFLEDGFVLANKRSIINTVLTNIGISFGANSTLLSYIIQLADSKEDTFSVMANSQAWQKDLTIFRICGWPDPITFELYSVLAFELSDSSFQEKKVGAGGAQSHYKFSNQYVSKEFFAREWKEYRV